MFHQKGGSSAEGEATRSFAEWSAARDEPRPAQRLHLSPAGFDVIAELKLRSPAAGALGDAADDWLGAWQRMRAAARRLYRC